MVRQTTADYCEAVPEDLNSASSDVSADTTVTATTDLDAVEADLAAVEAALTRLEAGTYWTDEVTGEPLATHLLENNPLLRRLPD